MLNESFISSHKTRVSVVRARMAELAAPRPKGLRAVARPSTKDRIAPSVSGV